MAFTWYDAYERPVDLAALKTEQAAPSASVTQRIAVRHPAAGLTPGRLAQIMRASIDADPEDYLALAEDIEERFTHYLSVISTRKLQVAGLEITVEAAVDDQRGIDMADIVREVIGRDFFELELRDILDATGKGFSCTEILWDTSEKDWRPKALKWRDPRLFRFDRVDGETPLLRDLVGGDQRLKPFGWIFHSFKAKSGLPIRGGLARMAAWPFLFSAFNAKDWAIFCEAYGQPLRLGKYDAGASEADKATLLEAVANIGVDYAAIVPQSMTVEMVGAQLSGNHEIYEKRADWLDRQVSKLVLGQTSTTDAQKGSYAVGAVHDRVRDDIEKADAKALAATLNRDLVKPLVDLNFGPQKVYPRIRIGRPEEVDLAKFMPAVKSFVSMGGKVAMSVVRDKLGLPDPGADEELLTTSASPPGRPNDDHDDDDPAAKPRTSAHAARHADGHADDAVDSAVDEALADWEPLVAPMIEGIEEKIAAATSIEEVETILADQFAGMDATALTARLARLAFAARISGEAGEES